MKSPLERAARALCELDNNPPGATMDGKPLWMGYLPEVRAVLQAIREPSAAMISAAWEHRREDDDHSRLGEEPLPEDAWPAMIDAALEEG